MKRIIRLFCFFLTCSILPFQSMSQPIEPLCQDLDINGVMTSAIDPVQVLGCTTGATSIVRTFQIENSSLSPMAFTFSGDWKFRNNGTYEEYAITVPTSSLSVAKTGNTATVSLSNWSFSDIPLAVDSMYAIVTVSENGNPLATCRSEVIAVTIDLESVGGTASSAQIICTGSQPQNISLTGQIGAVQWQVSTNGTTWSNISGATGNTLTGAQMGILTATRQYRARVTSGACAAAFSNSVVIDVSPISAGGTATPSLQTICSGNQPAAISLNGQTGAEIQWQWSSTGNNPWNDISGATSVTLSSNAMGVLSQTRHYRARVISSPCAAAFSNSVVVNVSPISVGGTATPNPQSICSGTLPGDISLSGQTGSAIQWQWSSTGNNPWTDIPGATSAALSSTQMGVLSQTRYYRARVISTPCTAAFSSTAVVNVSANSVGGNPAPGAQAICTGNEPTPISLSGQTGPAIQWQWSSTGNNPWTNISGATAATLSSSQMGILNQTRYYRAMVTNAPCGTVSSAIASVQVDPLPSATAGGSETICSESAFVVSGASSANGTRQWTHNGSGTLSNSTTLSPTYQSVSADGTNTVTLTLTVTSNNACASLEAQASYELDVLPVPSVQILTPNDVLLCQLPGQQVGIQNSTSSNTPPLTMQAMWESDGQTGSLNLAQGATGTAVLNLSGAAANQDFNITSLAFTNSGLPACTSIPSASIDIEVRPRPNFTIELNPNNTPGSINHLCSGYGTVAFEVDADLDNITWDADYTSPEETVQIENSPNVPLDNDLAGTHSIEITYVAYTDGPVCAHDPRDYPSAINEPSLSEIIQETPSRPELNALNASYLLNDGVIQFCTYSNLTDSAARVGRLIDRLDPGTFPSEGVPVRWRNWNPDNNNFSSPIAPQVLLDDGTDYYASVLSNDNCESRLDASDLFGNNTYVTVSLIAPPNSVSPDLFPDTECSGGVSFNLVPLPENLNDYCIWNIFAPELLSSSISDTCGVDPSDPFDFTLTNASNNSLAWEAQIYGRNVTNQVTCWAPPTDISITVNPNATFNPLSLSYEVCSNGENLVIDPVWNGIGEGSFEGEFWNTSSLPDDVGVLVSDNQVLTLLIAGVNPLPGVYPITIVGQYSGGSTSCSDSTTINVSILAVPEFEISVLDVDGTFCHSEYANIAVESANEHFTYAWDCESCEFDDFTGSLFQPRWINARPADGPWNTGTGSYTLTVTDTLTAERCANSQTVDIEIQADYASCPEGMDWFAPNGLSVVDAPAVYFQWYDVDGFNVFSSIAGATEQSYFPADNVDDCAPDRYIVATSLYADKCWSTTINCFEAFGLRSCEGPKSAKGADDFVVYPNPVVDGQLILEEMQGAPDARYQIEVYDLTGKWVYGEKYYISGYSQTQIELPALSYGVYLLQVSNNHYFKTFKIIVNN